MVKCRATKNLFYLKLQGFACNLDQIWSYSKYGENQVFSMRSTIDLAMKGSENKDTAEFQTQLLEFLMALGKALIAAGISVVDINSILERVASAYKVKAEVLIFPTVLLVKLGETESSTLTAGNQKPELLPLNQVSELYELIHQAENAEISPKKVKDV